MPDTADIPEWFTELQNAVLCRGPGHQGFGVRLRPMWTDHGLYKHVAAVGMCSPGSGVKCTS